MHGRRVAEIGHGKPHGYSVATAAATLPALTPDNNTTLLRRGNLAPLLLVNLGVAMHATIWYMATTAMPSAVEELDAAAYLSWATSVYLVTSILGGAMMAPAKGRLGALRSMVLAGFVVMGGGVLSAIAPSIFLVLAGRALQGLGEGFLVALSYALVRELFSNALVPRVFGTQAVSWAVAIVIGPLIGGWLTEIASWRAAFVCAALLPIPMQLLGWRILRGQRYEVRTQKAPLLRLSLLALGVMAIAAADRLPHPLWGFLSVVAGFVLMALVLKIDRGCAMHLFPTAFPNLRHPASLGLWVLLLMPLSEASVYVYGPYLLQMHRGLTPTMAGYFGAIHAVAWTVLAVAVGPLHARWQNSAILSGPLVLALGLAGLALTLAAQPLALVALSMVLVGVGFGISNAFLNQRVMAAAQPGQEDATAGAIPTIGGVGGAISAALAGLVGNAIGLDRTLTADTVARASLALFGGGALVAALAVWLAWRLLSTLDAASGPDKNASPSASRA